MLRTAGHSFSTRTSLRSFSLTHCRTSGSSSSQSLRNKNDRIKRSFYFWWERLDSNQLSRTTTDLQSAPALQLRRAPLNFFLDRTPEALAKGGAGRGNRTLISSLEGLHTSLCTMPAIRSSVLKFIRVVQMLRIAKFLRWGVY